MKLEIELNGAQRSVEVSRDAQGIHFSVDGHAIDADIVEVSPGIYSILIGSSAFEARVESASTGLRVTVGPTEFAIAISDPRKWSPSRASAFEAEGHQRVLAPMPGKVVRILVESGEKVEVGQGIAVVEAMKMQNEVRSPKSGTVERLLVRENQPVSAGEPLAVIV
jgi:biotin carboxyl carrier protein